MPTHKILADLDVGGEVKGTSLDVNGNADISGTIASGTITSTGIVKAATTFQATSGNMTFFVNNLGQALEIAQNTGDATFAGDVTVGDDLFMSNGGVISFNSGDVTITHSSNLLTIADGHLKMADSKRFYAGSGGDLEIYHDGTNAHFANSTGDLNINTSTGHMYIYNSADDKDIVFQSDNGSGGVATYMTLDGSAANIKVDTDMVIADNKAQMYGTGGDAFFKHTGSDFSFFNDTGNVTFNQRVDNGNIIFNCDDGSGGTTAYLTIDGSNEITQIGKGFLYLDNVHADFGNSHDLQIYHDGTDSYVSNTQNSGDLIIQNGGNDKDVIFKCDDGSNGLKTYLYLDGSTGGYVRIPDSGVFALGDGGDLILHHDASNSYIQQQGVGNLIIENTTDNSDVIFKSDDGSGGTTAYLTIDGSAEKILIHKSTVFSGGGMDYGVDGTGADVIFYGDTAGRDMKWDQSEDHLLFKDNTNLKIGTGGDFYMTHNGTDTQLVNTTGDIWIGNLANDKDIQFATDNGAGGDMIYFFLDGSAAAHNGSYTTAVYTQWGDRSHIAIGGAKDMQLYHDGSNSYIEQINGATGSLIIQQGVDDGDLIFNCDDGSGGTTSYLTLDGGLGYTTVQKQMNFGDGVVLALGASLDLQLFHESDNSFISSYIGDLTITNYHDDKDIIFRTDDGSGGIQTYLTIDGGADRTIFSRSSRHNDGVVAAFGASEDLQIYHDGSSSYIENGTGNLFIMARATDADISFQSDDGSGGDAEYLRLDGGVVKTVVSKPLLFADNISAEYGTDTDMIMYSSGSHGYIENYTGDLKFINNANDKDIIFQSDDGSGGVATYFFLDGSIAGGDGAGTLFTIWPDNSKIGLGDNADLRIDHNGTSSTINNLVGDLVIKNGADDGSVYLQSDDGSGGVTTYILLHGGLKTTYFQENGLFTDNKRLYFGSSGDLETYHDGSNSYIKNATGDLYIQQNADDKDLVFQCDDGSGGTTAYITLDGSVTRTIFSQEARFTDSVNLKFGTGGDSLIFHDGADSVIRNSTGHVYFDNLASDKDIYFRGNDGGSTITALTLDMSAGGNATFVGNVTLNSSLTFDYGGDHYLEAGTNTWNFKNSSGTTALQLNHSTQAATFAGKIQTSGEIEGGSLDINGNADIAGNLVISGTTALDVTANVDDNWAGRFENTDSGGFGILAKIAGTSSDEKVFEARVGGSTKMAVTGDGNATFAGNITSTAGYIRAHANSDTVPGFRMQSNDNHGWEFLHRATEGDFALNRETGGTTTEVLRISRSNGNATFAGDVKVNDSGKLLAGTGSDLKLYNDGTDSYIDSYTGSINMRNFVADSQISFSVDNGSGGGNIAEYFRVDGAYEVNRFLKNARFNDSVKANFGTGDDLQIYHNGSNSYITDQGTGNLFIEGSNHIYFRSADQGEYYAQFNDDGACKLYYNNVVKFETTSAGVNITGSLTASGNINANGNIVGDDSTSITNIAGIECDTVACDADNSTIMQLGATAINFLIADNDVLDLTENNTIVYNTLSVAQDIVHTGDVNNKIAFTTDTQTFTCDGNDSLIIRGNAVTDAPLFEINGAGAGNSLNIGLLMKGTVHGNPIKLKMQAENAGGTNTGAGILSYEPDADEFNIGQSTTHNSMAISIDNSENVTIDKRKFTKTSNTDADFSGDVVYFGSTTSMTAGKIYHYKSNGTWELVDADAASTCDGLLGVALGAASDTNGMLLRGMVTLGHDPGAVGDVLFASTTPGLATATAPSGSGDIVRVIGYCIDASNGQIWFNPDGTFVEVA